MRFFERQEDVRRTTVWLGLLFGLAVIGVVWAVNRLPFLALLYFFPRHRNFHDPHHLVPALPTAMQAAFSVDPWLTALVVGAIGTGALWTWSRVRRGGSAVAELAGGRPLAADTEDPAEVRLQHVIEEMAIASGIAAPAGYVLDGQGAINAFTAGHSIEDGAIAVTSGALEKLDRDELQAVVAHEMSHVLNGDSRINLRMMCLVGGLTGVKTAGWFLCLTAWKAARSLPVVVPFSVVGFIAGTALQIVGWFGALGGRLLKAAVSRQREFLADSSAVQFTRNPVALSGALRKMASDAGGVALSGVHVHEVSHMFFVHAVHASFARVFDTHPSIEERLAAIAGAQAAPAPVRPVRRTPETVVASFGPVGPAQVEYARRVHGRIPNAMLQSARTPSAARGVVAGLLLHDDARVRQAQVGILSSLRAPDVVEAALAAAECVRADAEALRLPLLELAMPALGRLRPEAKKTFLDALKALVDVDRKRTLFEFAVVALLEASLQPKPASADRVRFTAVAQVKEEAAELLWLLARAGGRAPSQVQAAWNAGVSRLGGRSGTVSTEPAAMPSVEVDDRVLLALATLRALAPAAKKDLLEALVACALADQAVSFAEAEVLRAVSAAIGAPLPPLLAAREPGRLVSEARA